MGRDEQKEEREVLDSIFPEEITDVNESEYRISIALDVPEAAHEEDHEPPLIVLRVSYPESYPDVAPELDLSAPPNARKYKDLDIQDDKARLLEALEPTMEENLGMPMIFTLVSTLKDAAEVLIAERQQATDALKQVEAAKVEEEENKKFHGTAVTRESFLDWAKKFKLEMVEDERRKQEEREVEEKKKRIVREEKKMTGRQLWERGLAGKFEEEDDLANAADGVAKLSIENTA